MIAGSRFLANLFQRQELLRVSVAPPDKVLYVIGDVHGRADLLRSLLRTIASDVVRCESDVSREVIFLGDYVDRGPDSRLTVDIVLEAITDRRFWDVTTLKGNHEESMLRFLRDADFWPTWSRHGASETLLSYGVTPPPAASHPKRWQEARQQLEAAIPPDHMEFFHSLELFASRGDYFCVHAGARPNVPLAEQAERDLLWIRDEFVRREHAFEQVIVHGHSRGPAFVGPHRIGLDTGAYLSGVLTAIKLKGASRTLIQTQNGSAKVG